MGERATRRVNFPLTYQGGVEELDKRRLPFGWVISAVLECLLS